MKLFWAISRHGNVGDDLNPILWPALFGDDFFNDSPRQIFIGVGSVMSTMWKFENGARKIVFGAGARSSWSLPAIDNEWDFRFVRGPNTANLLRKWNVDFLTDPAIMLPSILQPEQRGNLQPAARTIGFVPHHRTPKKFVEKIVGELGLVAVSPQLQPAAFVNALCACDYIVAEAMHGAILADAYRIPWIGVRILNELCEGFTTRFKWGDWLKSLELPEDCVVQAAPGMFRFARKGTNRFVSKIVEQEGVFDRFVERSIRLLRRSMLSDAWQLSRESVVGEKRNRILEEIQRLKSEYGR